MEIVMKMIICLRSGRKEKMGTFIKLNINNLKTISNKGIIQKPLPETKLSSK